MVVLEGRWKSIKIDCSAASLSDSSIPSQFVSSLSPSEEQGHRDVAGDVVIIVPSGNSGCVQTVLAIDSDPEHAANDSSGK